MIVGSVNTVIEPLVPVSLRGPNGAVCDIEAVLDTGFNGSITVPRSVIDALSMSFHGRSFAELADGAIRTVEIYGAEILWDGKWQPISVDAVESSPLLGMRLLLNRHLGIDVVPKGRVEITEINPRGGDSS